MQVHLPEVMPADCPLQMKGTQLYKLKCNVALTILFGLQFGNERSESWTYCRESSFRYIQEAAPSIDLDSAEIRICVANYADQSKATPGTSRPSWIDAAFEWCNEHMFEFIKVQSDQVCGTECDTYHIDATTRPGILIWWHKISHNVAMCVIPILDMFHTTSGMVPEDSCEGSPKQRWARQGAWVGWRATGNAKTASSSGGPCLAWSEPEKRCRSMCWARWSASAPFIVRRKSWRRWINQRGLALLRATNHHLFKTEVTCWCSDRSFNLRCGEFK